MPDLQEVFGSVGKVRLLLLLANSNELNITALSRGTGINHSKMNDHIAEMIDLGILQEKRFGRIRIISYNLDSEAGRRIKVFLKEWKSSYEVFAIG